jgi:hypothetical protein
VVARRRRNRAEPSPVEADDGVSVRTLASRHLLLVPSNLDPQLVSDLVRHRLPSSDLAGSGVLQMGRHCRVTGPYELSMEDAVDAGVPLPWTVCYCLEAPVEREDPPLPGMDDRDGFAYAFPDGLPWRDEGRALRLLVCLARRVGGAVRVNGSMQMIIPDPDRAVDHIVHSPTWLEPQVLLAVVGTQLPGARLAIDVEEWRGPSEAAYAGVEVAAEVPDDPLSPAELHRLHAAADAQDMRSLAGDSVIDGFAIVADLGWDGIIEVLVHLGDARHEPVVVNEDWAGGAGGVGGEFYTYEVRWQGHDPADREQRYPSEAVLASRSRVAPLVRSVTRVIVEAVGGVVLDEDGFDVDRYHL